MRSWYMTVTTALLIGGMGRGDDDERRIKQ